MQVISKPAGKILANVAVTNTSWVKLVSLAKKSIYASDIIEAPTPVSLKASLISTRLSPQGGSVFCQTQDLLHLPI